MFLSPHGDGGVEEGALHSSDKTCNLLLYEQQGCNAGTRGQSATLLGGSTSELRE